MTMIEKLNELSYINDAESQQLLSSAEGAWNATKVERERVNALHHLIEAQVEKTPDAIAVRYGDTAWSYRELNERANQLAHYLCRYGAGPDVLVGLFVERSLDSLIALLGILKAGSAYVPLDPAYPSRRLAFILADSNVNLLLTQDAIRSRLPETESEVRPGNDATAA